MREGSLSGSGRGRRHCSAAACAERHNAEHRRADVANEGLVPPGPYLSGWPARWNTHIDGSPERRALRGPDMTPALVAIFEQLDANGVSYCLLRDAERLTALERGGELDLLVDPVHFGVLTQVFQHHRFVKVPAWGHAPHHFLLHYAEASDVWLKCDVVTEVAYGRPVHALRTDLGTACLAHRRRTGHTFGPSAEEELVTLLLHCVIDKQSFPAERIARLKSLRARSTRTDVLTRHLTRYWSSTMTWPALAEMIDEDRWESLLASRACVIETVAAHDRIGTAWRGARDRVLRKLGRAVGLVRPSYPSIALLAPDGAGKSTLAAGLRDRLPVPVAVVYMGLYQQRGRRRAWSRVPGLGLAAHVLTQWRRYLLARARQAQGAVVLFDRYTYDALLPARHPSSPLRRLRRSLLAWSCPAPDLVILLDAPGEVLHARKQEHEVTLLDEQRQAYLRLRPLLKRTAVVDATSDPQTIRRIVMTLIWRVYCDTHSGRPRR